MRPLRQALLAACVLACLAGPARAADPEIAPCTEGDAATEAADRALVAALRAALVGGHPDEVVQRGPALEALLARHPDRHRIEHCGDVIRVNSGDPDDALFVQADMVGTITKATASTLSVDGTQSYLVLAHVIAAALADGRGDRATAARWVAAGRRIAPAEPLFRLVDPATPPAGQVRPALAAEISRRGPG